MTNSIPYNTVPCPSVARVRRRPVEAARDPYDGLRPWSAITHGAGLVLSVIGTVLLLYRALTLGCSSWRVAGFAIYGLSLIVLYTASTLYHSVNTTVEGRILLRKCDHTAIYFLIAGTYTPICLTALRGAMGYTLLAIVWGLAFAGVFMSIFWINCPRIVSSSIYLAMGWMLAIAAFPLSRTVGASGILWLLAGGILYSVGGILYALKWPGRDNPRFGCHEIFHVFIVLGSIAHFLMIYLILPTL